MDLSDIAGGFRSAVTIAQAVPTAKSAEQTSAGSLKLHRSNIWIHHGGTDSLIDDCSAFKFYYNSDKLMGIKAFRVSPSKKLA